MSSIRIIAAVAASGIVASLTDWLFMGDLLYRRFNKYPEIWRVTGKDESSAIAWSSPLPFLTCGVFVWLCIWLHLSDAGDIFKLATLIWLIAPLPLLLVTALFMKLQWQIAASYAAGWLVKLLVAASAVVWILR